MAGERMKMAGCIIRDSTGALLLLHRRDKPNDQVSWELPGGKVDEGERPRQAASREGREETGRIVKVKRYLGRALMTFVDEHRKRDIEYRYYSAVIPEKEGHPEVAEREVHDAIEFVSPEELEKRRRLGQLSLAVVSYMQHISEQAA